MAKQKEKAKCPITRADFVKHAKPLMADEALANVLLEPKEFATGSFGYYAGDKVTLQINGTPVRCQLGVNLTVIGSKEEKKAP